MLNTSSAYADKILSDDRQFRVKAAFGSRVITGEDAIAEMELEELVNAEDVITMGSACSSKLTLKLINAPRIINYDREIIYVDIGLVLDDGSVEYIPMGVFYPSEVKTDNDYADITITAYDGMCLLEKEFISTIPQSQRSVSDIMQEIAELAGIEISDSIKLITDKNIPFIPEKVTYRQMICYIAGKLGCYARFDRTGKLEFTWYEDNGYEVSPEHQYLNGFKKTLISPVTVTGIISGSEEDAYSRGLGANGVIISFENPFMEREDITEIWENKIANVSDAQVTLVYNGLPETDNFVLIYKGEGKWQKSDGCDLYRGDILAISEKHGWNSENDKIRVEKISEDDVSLIYIDGSEITDVPAESSLTAARIIQWTYEDMADEEITEGEVLTLVSSAGWEIPPKTVLVTGKEPANKELIIIDGKDEFFAEPVPGTSCIVPYRKVDQYRIKYQPSELKWRGNPAVQAGDILHVSDRNGEIYTVPVMSQKILLNGGLEAEVICEGTEESDAGFSSSNSPTAQRITKIYSDLYEAINRVTNTLTGKIGGDISFRYNDAGVPTEILISDREDPENSNNVWRWNSNGLGFSSTGIDGPYETAITRDGYIVGKFIGANTVSAESIDINSLISTYNENDEYHPISDKHIILQGGAIADGILAAVRTTGGSNLIYNSSGGAGLEDGWNVGDGTKVRVDDTGSYSNELISQRAFELGEETAKGTLETDVAVTVGEEHTLSFKYKKDSGNLKVDCVGEEILDETESFINWRQKVYSFIPSVSPVHLRFHSSDGGTYVGDIMLCKGNGTTWTQGSNELFGTNLSVTNDKVEISSAGKEEKGIKTNLTASGLKIIYYDGSSGEEGNKGTTIAQYDSSKVKTGQVEASAQISTGNTRFIPINEDMACMWVIDKERKEE